MMSNTIVDDEDPCNSLANLHLHDEDSKRSSHASLQIDHSTPDSLPTKEKPPNLIICDAWYGFPTQKRPRKERVCAVSRQLTNFLDWRLELKLNAQGCKVQLLGTDFDVNAVQERINEIATDVSVPEKYSSELVYRPNLGIHQAIQRWRSEYNTDEEVVYLSPDALVTLQSSTRPPRVVIVGMLIDRRITSDRSRKRAEETLNLRAVKLPLDEMNVKEMSSDEPLNVDTVMELMQRWWFNCSKLEEQLKGNTESIKNSASRTLQYKKCFVDAAAWAMKSHRERHPNRTVHKN
jgi:hypothetical protein